MNIKQRIQLLADAIRRRNLSERTVSNYCSVAMSFFNFCNGRGFKTPKQSIDEYLKCHCSSMSTHTRNLHISAIKFYLEHVSGIVLSVKDVPYQKRAKSIPNIFSMDEIRRIFAIKMNSKHRLILEMLYGCGMRLNEIVNLKVGDVSLDRQLLHVKNGKGMKDRLIPIRDLNQSLLTSYIQFDPNDWVFNGQHEGEHITKRTVQRIVDNVCQKAGINKRVHPHMFRHSYATHLMDSGVDMRIIQQLLGHSSIKTTQIYTHVSVQHLLKVNSPLVNIRM